jgi:hypothetical protein
MIASRLDVSPTLPLTIELEPGDGQKDIFKGRKPLPQDRDPEASCINMASEDSLSLPYHILDFISTS